MVACRLYPSCPWDLKVVRRLVVERKIAPRFPGREAADGAFSQECPICFMVRPTYTVEIDGGVELGTLVLTVCGGWLAQYYPGNLNVSSCCKKPICSECYLQMRPPQKPIRCAALSNTTTPW